MLALKIFKGTLNPVCDGPNFTGLVSLNVVGIALDHISFQFWIGLSCVVPEIFAIKVGRCVKSHRILHVFGPKIF